MELTAGMHHTTRVAHTHPYALYLQFISSH